MDIHSWVLVSHFNYIKSIHSDFSTYLCKFICKCNIHIPKGVFHTFGQFCSFRFSFNYFPFNKGSVNISCLTAALFCYSTYNSVVVYQFFHDLSRENSFRAMSKEQIFSNCKSFIFKDWLYYFISGHRSYCRFNDNNVSLFQNRQDGLACGNHIA